MIAFLIGPGGERSTHSPLGPRLDARENCESIRAPTESMQNRPGGPRSLGVHFRFKGLLRNSKTPVLCKNESGTLDEILSLFVTKLTYLGCL